MCSIYIYRPRWRGGLLVSGTVGPARRQWLEAPGRTSRFLFALVQSSGNLNWSSFCGYAYIHWRALSHVVAKPKEFTINSTVFAPSVVQFYPLLWSCLEFVALFDSKWSENRSQWAHGANCYRACFYLKGAKCNILTLGQTSNAVVFKCNISVCLLSLCRWYRFISTRDTNRN